MKPKILVYMGLFAALNVILRLLEINTGFGRIDFSFVSLSLGASLFGPVLGGISGAIADVMYYFRMGGGLFFFPYTLAAALKGVIWGLLLYKKEKTYFRIALAAFLCILLADIPSTYLYLTMYVPAALSTFYLILIRTLVYLGYFIVQVNLIYLLFKHLKPALSRFID